VSRLASSALGIALVTVLSLSLALAARHALIEVPDFAAACDASPWDGACALRSAVVQAFLGQRIGWFALAAATAGLLTRRAAVSTVALFAACAGLVLYSAGPSAPAALLAALALLRPRADRAV